MSFTHIRTIKFSFVIHFKVTSFKLLLQCQLSILDCSIQIEFGRFVGLENNETTFFNLEFKVKIFFFSTLGVSTISTVLTDRERNWLNRFSWGRFIVMFLVCLFSMFVFIMMRLIFLRRSWLEKFHIPSLLDLFKLFTVFSYMFEELFF